MSSIFNKAYFGKPYKTRDGRKAIYYFHNKNNKWHELIVDGETITLPYHDNGLMFGNIKGGEWDEDIVAEWEEEIGPEELDAMAWSKAREEYIDDYIEPYAEGYKAGFCAKDLYYLTKP